RYRHKLAYTALKSGRPVWIDDTSLNLEYHVRHTALSAPARWQDPNNAPRRPHPPRPPPAPPPRGGPPPPRPGGRGGGGGGGVPPGGGGPWMRSHTPS